MRSHRRREPLEHVLVAGDLSDLDSIHALLACLPATAYGQVIVETSGDDVLPTLPTPARVSVTQLRRPASGVASSSVEPAERLVEAVNAWLAEWVPDDPEPDRVFSIWIGSCARHRVRAWSAPLESL